MNRFRYDVHDLKTPFLLMSLVSGIIGALLVVLAVKFTGLGNALVIPPVKPEVNPTAQIQPVAVYNPERAIIDVVNRVWTVGSDDYHQHYRPKF